MSLNSCDQLSEGRRGPLCPLDTAPPSGVSQNCAWALSGLPSPMFQLREQRLTEYPSRSALRDDVILQQMNGERHRTNCHIYLKINKVPWGGGRVLNHRRCVEVNSQELATSIQGQNPDLGFGGKHTRIRLTNPVGPER